LVLGLIAANVRLRFPLDAATFADRLLDLAHRAPAGPDKGPCEHVRRLSLDDLYLATACSQGDENAWEELAERHQGFIRDFARRFLRAPDATDLADQVVADLWQRRKIARYEGRSTLRTWLGAVVGHAALNAAKSGHRAASLDKEDRLGGAPAVAVATEPAANETRSLLARLAAEAIGGLPPSEKLLLYLYYEQDLTLDQMAVSLHASKAALSRQLTRTRSNLRAAIGVLARQATGAPAEALRAGIDLGSLELDLSDLLGRARNETGPVLSKNGECIQPEHDEPSPC
jgi:RNA polymerase sigma factor (sigma-70 family)